MKDGLKQPEPELNYDELTQAISDANSAKQDIQTSDDDGYDIDREKRWVDSETMQTFKAAIQAAEQAKSSAEEQDELTNAKTTLEAAKSVFEEAIKDGLKIVPTAETPSAEQLTTVIGGKQISELVGDDYNISFAENTLTATGKVNPIPNWTEAFPEAVVAQTNYYIPSIIKSPDGSVVESTTLDGKTKQLVFGETDDDPGTMVLVSAIKPDEPTRTMTIYPDAAAAQAKTHGIELTLSAAGCEFLPIPTELGTTGIIQDSDTGYDFNEALTEASVTLDEKPHTIKVTGTFVAKPEWQETLFPSTPEAKYFLGITLTGKKDEAIKVYKDLSLSETEVKVFGQTNDTDTTMDIYFAINQSNQNLTFTAYPSEADAQADKNATQYTIDYSECSFQ